jgi:hypothetical protein
MVRIVDADGKVQVFIEIPLLDQVAFIDVEFGAAHCVGSSLERQAAAMDREDGATLAMVLPKSSNADCGRQSAPAAFFAPAEALVIATKRRRRAQFRAKASAAPAGAPAAFQASDLTLISEMNPALSASSVDLAGRGHYGNVRAKMTWDACNVCAQGAFPFRVGSRRALQ